MKVTLFYFYTLILFLGLISPLRAQNNATQNVDNLLTSTQWNSLFPKERELMECILKVTQPILFLFEF